MEGGTQSTNEIATVESMHALPTCLNKAYILNLTSLPGSSVSTESRSFARPRSASLAARRGGVCETLRAPAMPPIAGSPPRAAEAPHSGRRSLHPTRNKVAIEGDH